MARRREGDEDGSDLAVTFKQTRWNAMKRFVLMMAVCVASSAAFAQVGTTAKEGADATAEKAKQVGDQTKAAMESQPDKSIDKAKAHSHAKAAKDAAKEVPK
jgi:hypothetical protein